MEKAISEMSPSELPPSLFSALHHHDEMRRNQAWFELVGHMRQHYPQLADPMREASGFLIELLDSEHGNIRAHAAEELGRMRITSATDKLCTLVEDSYWSTRRAAILALGHINNPAAVPVLNRQIAHTRDVPLVVSSLTDIDDPSAVSAIVAALEDANPYIRVEAIQGVIDGRYIRAVPVLIEMTRDDTQLQLSTDGGPTPTVADSARRALDQLNELSLSPDIPAHKTSPESLQQLKEHMASQDRKDL
ncbi:MAG: hypothetical protein EP297_14445 [Gammaproteobacteria bacterium]|nr:MAG: hypothetical protein EP297_14445 [Gammaproteobacteria bacterium]